MRETDFVGEAEVVALAAAQGGRGLHSPTPSSVKIAASSKGDGKNALAACDSW